MRMITFLCTAVLCSGCVASRGTNFWYESPNPQTSVSANPVTRSVSIYDNTGRKISVEEAGGKTKDGGEFHIKGLTTDERSVENRAASVAQISAVGQNVVAVAQVWAPVVQSLIDNLTSLGEQVSSDNAEIKKSQVGMLSQLKQLTEEVAKLRAAQPPVEHN